MTRSACAPCLLLALVLLPACNKSDEPTAVVGAEAAMVVDVDLGADAVVEEHDEGTVAWEIAPDGQVRAAVTGSAGARVKEDVSGSLVYKLESGEPKTVPLVLEPKTGLLVAAGPKLETDLTEVSYTVQVSGKPWSGVMHVPVGGTAALVASAKTSVEVKLPDETVGPHGGTIQVVGDDRLEMVGDEGGEVRVYVLDADLQPRTSIEGRTLRMGFIAGRPEVVTFTHASGGAYFVGRFGTAAVVDPLRVTVSLGFGGVTRSAIWGYRPGVRVVAPTAKVRLAAAPRLRFRLTGGFDSDVDVYGRSRVHVHHHGDHRHDDHRHDDHRHDDHRHGHDHRKGDNGRHFGQDGTFARDSGGFKSDNAKHPGGKDRDVGARGNHHVSHDSGKRGGSDRGSSSRGGGGNAKGGGGSAKGGGGDKGGGKGGKR